MFVKLFARICLDLLIVGRNLLLDLSLVYTHPYQSYTQQMSPQHISNVNVNNITLQMATVMQQLLEAQTDLSELMTHNLCNDPTGELPPGMQQLLSTQTNW